MPNALQGHCFKEMEISSSLSEKDYLYVIIQSSFLLEGAGRGSVGLESDIASSSFSLLVTQRTLRSHGVHGVFSLCTLCLLRTLRVTPNPKLET